MPYVTASSTFWLPIKPIKNWEKGTGLLGLFSKISQQSGEIKISKARRQKPPSRTLSQDRLLHGSPAHSGGEKGCPVPLLTSATNHLQHINCPSSRQHKLQGLFNGKVLILHSVANFQTWKSFLPYCFLLWYMFKVKTYKREEELFNVSLWFPIEEKKKPVKGIKKLTCNNNLMKCCGSCQLSELIFATDITTVCDRWLAKTNKRHEEHRTTCTQLRKCHIIWH